MSEDWELEHWFTDAGLRITRKLMAQGPRHSLPPRDSYERCGFSTLRSRTEACLSPSVTMN